jgi:hypothetical protein
MELPNTFNVHYLNISSFIESPIKMNNNGILFLFFLLWVKCIFSTCALSQNQIGTLVLKNITNGTCGYQINPLGTSVRIPLVFLTECHVTLTHGVIPVVLRRYVA